MNVLVMCSRGYGQTYSAVNTKSEYIAVGLRDAGCVVRILDSVRGWHNTSCEINTNSEGIEYVSFPKVLFCNTYSNIKIYKHILLKYRQSGGINHIIIGMEYMPIFIMLAKCAKSCGYSVSTLSHEWHIGMKTKGIVKSVHKYWQDLCFGRYVDAILPISHYLQTKCEHFGKPMMLLPILGRYDALPSERVENCFTYCADAGYLLRNKLILEAFKILHTKHQNTRLALVLFGTEDDMSDVRCTIEEMKIAQHVTILNQIVQSELERLYASSSGLIIPLNPEYLPDVARFSQKIAEYVASGRPIITSNVGEIPYYFKNNESAIIVDYTPSAYAEGMELLINNPLLATEVGRNGYKTGMMNFNYRDYGLNLKNFISAIR